MYVWFYMSLLAGIGNAAPSGLGMMLGGGLASGIQQRVETNSGEFTDPDVVVRHPSVPINCPSRERGPKMLCCGGFDRVKPRSLYGID